MLRYKVLFQKNTRRKQTVALTDYSDIADMIVEYVNREYPDISVELIDELPDSTFKCRMEQMNDNANP